MKKKSIFPIAGVLGLALALVVLAGCPTSDDDDDNPFVGTWVGSINYPYMSTTVEMSVKFIIDGTTWTQQMKAAANTQGDYENNSKGTYTRNGNTATIAQTHTWQDDTWAEDTDGDLPDSITVSGNTLTLNGGDLDGTEFTKQ